MKRPGSDFWKAVNRGWEQFLCPFSVMTENGEDATAHSVGKKLISALRQPEMMFTTGMFAGVYGLLMPIMDRLSLREQTLPALAMLSLYGVLAALRYGPDLIIGKEPRYFVGKEQDPAMIPSDIAKNLRQRRGLAQLTMIVTCLAGTATCVLPASWIITGAMLAASGMLSLGALSDIKRTSKALNYEWGVSRENPSTPKERTPQGKLGLA